MMAKTAPPSATAPTDTPSSAAQNVRNETLKALTTRAYNLGLYLFLMWLGTAVARDRWWDLQHGSSSFEARDGYTLLLLALILVSVLYNFVLVAYHLIVLAVHESNLLLEESSTGTGLLSRLLARVRPDPAALPTAASPPPLAHLQRAAAAALGALLLLFVAGSPLGYVGCGLVAFAGVSAGGYALAAADLHFRACILLPLSVALFGVSGPEDDSAGKSPLALTAALGSTLGWLRALVTTPGRLPLVVSIVLLASSAAPLLLELLGLAVHATQHAPPPPAAAATAAAAAGIPHVRAAVTALLGAAFDDLEVVVCGLWPAGLGGAAVCGAHGLTIIVSSAFLGCALLLLYGGPRFLKTLVGAGIALAHFSLIYLVALPSMHVGSWFVLPEAVVGAISTVGNVLVLSTYMASSYWAEYARVTRMNRNIKTPNDNDDRTLALVDFLAAFRPFSRLGLLATVFFYVTLGMRAGFLSTADERTLTATVSALLFALSAADSAVNDVSALVLASYYLLRAVVALGIALAALAAFEITGGPALVALDGALRTWGIAPAGLGGLVTLRDPLAFVLNSFAVSSGATLLGLAEAAGSQGGGGGSNGNSVLILAILGMMVSAVVLGAVLFLFAAAWRLFVAGWVRRVAPAAPAAALAQALFALWMVLYVITGPAATPSVLTELGGMMKNSSSTTEDGVLSGGGTAFASAALAVAHLTCTYGQLLALLWLVAFVAIARQCVGSLLEPDSLVSTAASSAAGTALLAIFGARGNLTAAALAAAGWPSALRAPLYVLARYAALAPGWMVFAAAVLLEGSKRARGLYTQSAFAGVVSLLATVAYACVRVLKAVIILRYMVAPVLTLLFVASLGPAVLVFGPELVQDIAGLTDAMLLLGAGVILAFILASVGVGLAFGLVAPATAYGGLRALRWLLWAMVAGATPAEAKGKEEEGEKKGKGKEEGAGGAVEEGAAASGKVVVTAVVVAEAAAAPAAAAASAVAAPAVAARPRKRAASAAGRK
jgi:hypothetical protein